MPWIAGARRFKEEMPFYAAWWAREGLVWMGLVAWEDFWEGED